METNCPGCYLFGCFMLVSGLVSGIRNILLYVLISGLTFVVWMFCSVLSSLVLRSVQWPHVSCRKTVLVLNSCGHRFPECSNGNAYCMLGVLL